MPVPAIGDAHATALGLGGQLPRFSVGVELGRGTTAMRGMIPL
ncbi:hypothetical protein [Gemmobacter serpentinus]|nr:hypothetical protein [Gemmobacter serpentinus]